MLSLEQVPRSVRKRPGALTVRVVKGIKDVCLEQWFLQCGPQAAE